MKKSTIALLALCATGTAFGQAIITEIMSNPASDESTTATQYIEIANITAAPLNLSGWTLDDEDADGPNTLPNVDIPAYGVAVITGSSAADFNAAWGASMDANAVLISLSDLGQTMISLSNSPSSTSEILVLTDGTSTVDEVNFDDTSPWPGDPNGQAFYLAVSGQDAVANGAALNDDGANWMIATAGVNGAITSVISGVWNAEEQGAPGNYLGQGTLSDGGGGGTLSVAINEFSANHSGSDFREYLEVAGEASTDYSHLTLLQVEGDSEDGPGIIVNTFAVGTTNDAGFWYTGFLTDVLGNGSKTFFLVDGFSGMAADDLDSDDDGTLDSTPWTEIIDAVAVSDEDPNDQTYAATVLTQALDANPFEPGGASRIPDKGSNWDRNAFNGAGLPGLSGSVSLGEAANTPNETNGTTIPQTALINEVVADHVGSDTHEFAEIIGAAETDYSGFQLLQVDGNLDGNPGEVLSVVTLGTTNIAGLWDSGFQSDLFQDSSSTFLLVKGFSGTVAMDLDGNDDGQLEFQPWTVFQDAIALNDGGAGDLFYGLSAAAGFDGGATVPGGLSRLPNGVFTNSITDWTRNDFDGEGLPGFTGTLVDGEALNTPGASNATSPTGAVDAVINEFSVSHSGGDRFEYFEIYGSANTNYANLWLLLIEGDSGQNPGAIDAFFQAGTTDDNGIWVTGFQDERFENESYTIMLVSEFTGPANGDIDSNDDGTVDTTLWTALIDSVSVEDGDLGDLSYGQTVLGPNFDGISSFEPGGASRFPDGTDSDTIADWLRNDFSGAGFPGYSGDLTAGEALNTPGLPNSDQLPPGTGAILSEFVIDHVGSDTNEFIEIFGTARTNFRTTFILVINGDVNGNPGEILHVFTAGDTSSAGVWSTGFQSDLIANSAQTIMVVEDFTGNQGDDLDTDDNGVLDTEPWSAKNDALSLADSSANINYASLVLESPGARGTSIVGGASRLPHGINTGTLNDWVPNDFEGAGMDGFGGSADSGEAYNTPGMVNRRSLDDYYRGVSTLSQDNLRNTLHQAIRGHAWHPYTDTFTDTWDVLEIADEDPGNPANVISVYRNASFAKEGGGNNFYNREHTWPKSYGFPELEDNNYPYTDFHHLRISDANYNSARNNKAYGDCDGGCTEAPTDANNGVGGGAGTYPGNSNWYEGSGGNGIYEVWHHRRGDIARGLLYMDVRYEGGTHPVTGASEPDLILTDDTGLILTTGTNTTGNAYMGRLNVLLQWHLDDPVDEAERIRNDVVFTWQGNRNPFVDNPNWIDCIFLGDCPSCLLNYVPLWQVSTSPCGGTATTSVLDLVANIIGTCACP